MLPANAIRTIRMKMIRMKLQIRMVRRWCFLLGRGGISWSVKKLKIESDLESNGKIINSEVPRLELQGYLLHAGWRTPQEETLGARLCICQETQNRIRLRPEDPQFRDPQGHWPRAGSKRS